MAERADEPALRASVLRALHGVVDPELGLDVVELGLVYRVDVRGADVEVDLTMTTPACPMGEQIVRDAEQRIDALDGVAGVIVRLVWDPPWTPERMSEGARAALGWAD